MLYLLFLLLTILSVCVLPHRWQWASRQHVWHRVWPLRFSGRQRRWCRQPRRWRRRRHHQHVPPTLTDSFPSKQQPPPPSTPPHLRYPPPPPSSQQQQQQQQWPGLHHTQGRIALRGTCLHSRWHSHSQRPGAAGVLCAGCWPGGLGQDPHCCWWEVRSPQHTASWGQRQLLWMGGRNQSGFFVLCFMLFTVFFSPIHFTTTCYPFWPLT